MKTFITLIAVFAFVSQGYAKAKFYSRSELVTKATVIAIIELEEPVEIKPDPFANSTRGEYWTYSTKAKAKVVKMIKGEISREFELYGGEGFICARCTLAKGKYLAFLKKDGAYWAGLNWHLSLRPITEGKVEWYAQGQEQSYSTSPMAYQPLNRVVAEVEEILAKKAESERTK